MLCFRLPSLLLPNLLLSTALSLVACTGNSYTKWRTPDPAGIAFQIEHVLLSITTPDFWKEIFKFLPVISTMCKPTTPFEWERPCEAVEIPPG